MGNSRKLAIDIISQVLDRRAYSNIVLGAALKKSNLNDKDKGLVTEIVYGTIKYKYTIDKILKFFLKDKFKNLDSLTLNILRSAIYQIRFLDKVPDFAAVDEAVEIAKKYKSIGVSKLVNAVLRNYLRNMTASFSNDDNSIESLSFKYSFEPWMTKLFIVQYGKDTAVDILEGLNKVPDVTVRTNILKTNYEEAYDKLEDAGYNVEEGFVCPEAIKIIRGKSIEQNQLFSEGFITVQDESAMLVGSSMEITENLTVLDLCSAPGGKATHIAELLDNTGKVKAFDIHENKLSLIKENAERLGITNLECDVLDASICDETLKNSADRVLIDVPCSGLGIIRKKPEIKWTKDNKQLKEIVSIQRKIMLNAAKYVKTNGIILYSTCTLNKEENEENIKWFLKKNPEFNLEPLYYGNLDNFKYENGMVTIIPNEAMDGFFIAKLRKNK